MQEEVTQKTIALSVKTARVTADVLKNMLRKYLSGQKQKGKNPYKVGKQSYKELKSQGSGLSNIEITDGNIKSFERVAKKYRLDFALKKDSSTKPPTYYVFFKGQDTEMMNLAFKKYLGVQMNKKDKPSIMKKLMHFKDASIYEAVIENVLTTYYYDTAEFESLMHYTVPVRISIPQDKMNKLQDALSHDGKEIVPFYYCKKEKQKPQVRFDDKCRTAECLGLIHKFVNDKQIEIDLPSELIEIYSYRNGIHIIAEQRKGISYELDLSKRAYRRMRPFIDQLKEKLEQDGKI